MTNIPDLTNALPGDVYQGPDGRQWEVAYPGPEYVKLVGPVDTGNDFFVLAGPRDSKLLDGFKKVDGE